MFKGRILDDEVHFNRGNRKEAIKIAIEMVRKKGQSAELVICNDIPGEHTGGEDCFCDPLILRINPEDL